MLRHAIRLGAIVLRGCLAIMRQSIQASQQHTRTSIYQLYHNALNCQTGKPRLWPISRPLDLVSVHREQKMYLNRAVCNIISYYRKCLTLWPTLGALWERYAEYVSQCQTCRQWLTTPGLFQNPSTMAGPLTLNNPLYPRAIYSCAGIILCGRFAPENLCHA